MQCETTSVKMLPTLIQIVREVYMNEIQVSLTNSEYKSIYDAIKFCADSSYYSASDEDCKNLNTVLLKMMKAKDPDYFSNIGPW